MTKTISRVKLVSHLESEIKNLKYDNFIITDYQMKGAVESRKAYLTSLVNQNNFAIEALNKVLSTYKLN
jgi:hypothetical protein